MDAGVDVADNRAFVHAPKHSANLYLDMRLARFGWADLRGLIDYAYTDSFYTYAYQLSGPGDAGRSEEHTSELQSLMRSSYAVFCLTKKKYMTTSHNRTHV